MRVETNGTKNAQWVMREIEKQSENFTKEIEDMKKNQTENISLRIPLLRWKKNSIERFNSRLNKSEERIGILESKVVEVIQSESKTK